MDPSSFPKQYGGELEWQWGDMPNLDEPANELLQGVKTDGEKADLLKGPMLFKGDEVEVLGAEDGKERRKTVAVPQTQQPLTHPAESSSSEADSVPIASENEKVAVVSSEEAQTTTAAA